MFVKFDKCETVNGKPSCIKVDRNEFRKEPKKYDTIEWLGCGYSYIGMVYHKNVKYIYIKVLD